ncbi:MAG: 3'(2'),5'-bisphosphate nucleotidase [Acidiferrobacteraceae bacterium]|nr:3'(2'),5'-bisphosphate nucleotidase [Acidiferrobacteraceae bacterium]|tara:strand:+ start:394 stop:1227 length:834 start_codon:yes stop_codon:yes gene_type:complete
MTLIDKNLDLFEEIVEVSQGAGEIILDIYENSNHRHTFKEDNSPLTKADTESNKFIVNKLKKITPHLPLLSEEEKRIPFNNRSSWKEYWLIDPLDGTKEFIKRNGEFTVNIALIRNNIPVFGVIDIPVKKQTYWGAEGIGSFIIKNNKKSEKIYVANESKEKMRILSSRSHKGDERILLKKINDYKLIKAGSSLKFCLIASGEADAYIRLGPTSEWDIAAGDAIVRFAGGIIVDLNNKGLEYNKGESLINPNFIVTKDRVIKEKLLSIIKETQGITY